MSVTTEQLLKLNNLISRLNEVNLNENNYVSQKVSDIKLLENGDGKVYLYYTYFTATAEGDKVESYYLEIDMNGLVTDLESKYTKYQLSKMFYEMKPLQF